MADESINKQNGKGSKPRPISVSYEKYSDNWDNIFKRNDSTVEKKPKTNKK